MITCKQDLINTYVKNTPELRKEFLSLAVKFGLIDSGSKIGESSEEAVVAYWNDVTGDNPKVGCWYAYADQIKEECRELTLSDLKPRTKVEYEKVTLSLPEKSEILESGEWLYLDPDGRSHIDMNCAANWTIGSLRDREVYRKVERPVEWWEDAADYLNSKGGFDAYGNDSEGLWIRLKNNVTGVAMSREDWCDFARILLEQEGE